MGTEDLKGICLIEIGGDSCANCIAVMPVMSELASQFGLKFIRIDPQEEPSLAKNFKIDRIPAIILADGGKVFAQCSGYQPSEILGVWIEAKLEEYKGKTQG